MHGGQSTGARTAEGRERCRAAPLKHGQRSASVVAERRKLTAEARELLTKSLELYKEAVALTRAWRQQG
jgi:hypothetical protein